MYMYVRIQLRILGFCERRKRLTVTTPFPSSRVGSGAVTSVDVAVIIWWYIHVHVYIHVDIKAEIDESSRDYVNNVSRLSKEERSKSLNKIQEMFKKATENSDNKVQIAMQMYEMVSLC